MIWSPDLVKMVAGMRGDRLSASQIAGNMSIHLGADINRNMIIGVMNRNPREMPAPPPKAPPVPPKPAAKPRREPAQADAPIPAVIVESVAAGPAQHVPARLLTIFELRDNTCRFPIGDPRAAGFGYCGKECDPARPYCTRHLALAYSRQVAA